MKNKIPTFTSKDCELIKKEVLFQSRFRYIRLQIRHRLFNGEWSGIFAREILERFKAVAVLPYDPVLDRVILIEQFRVGSLSDPISPWQIEIPAGIIDSDETPLEVAVRETQEEAGCSISNLQLMYEYFVSPGVTDEYLYIFWGHVDASHIEGVFGLEHEHENIRVLNLKTEEAFEMLRNKQIKNAPAIIALQWLMLNKGKI